MFTLHKCVRKQVLLKTRTIARKFSTPAMQAHKQTNTDDLMDPLASEQQTQELLERIEQ